MNAVQRDRKRGGPTNEHWELIMNHSAVEFFNLIVQNVAVNVFPNSLALAVVWLQDKEQIYIYVLIVMH